jgi:AraC-like DNA-binding protein
MQSDAQSIASEFDDEVATAVKTSVFSVNSLPTRQRFPVWRASLASIFDIERLPSTPMNGFHGELDAVSFGGLFVARTKSVSLLWDRSSSTIARDGMDHFMVQLVENGRMKIKGDGPERTIRPGQIFIRDLREDSRSETTDFTNLSLILPRSVLEPFLRAPDDQHTRVLSEREPLVALLREHMRSVMRHGPRMSVSEAREVAPATAAMVAACLNAGLEDREGLGEGVGRAMVSLLKSHIEDHLTDRSLTTDRLARDFGLSRSKLYRMFQPLGGVASYVRERRLRYAMSVLMDATQAGTPIYLIATRAGFGDETDFSRAFRRRFGFTPRDVRRTALADGAGSEAIEGVDRRYEGWLHNLAAA